MEKLKPILSLVLRILFALVLVTTTILSISTAYIIFAPDDFPKPFYLVYAYPDTGVPPSYTLSKPSSEGSGQTSENSSGENNSSSTASEGTYLPGEGIMFDTGTKVINLADEGGNKYISISISLEFAPDDSVAYEEYLSGTTSSGGEGASTTDYLTAFTEKLTQKKPIMDDIITLVISSHKYADVYTLEGKDTLKQEIVERINQSIPGFQVIAVYFTNFVVEG